MSEGGFHTFTSNRAAFAADVVLEEAATPGQSGGLNHTNSDAVSDNGSIDGEVSKARYIIMPDNKWRQTWEAWAALVIMYTSVGVPFIVFFGIAVTVDSTPELFAWETVVYCTL